MSQQYATVLAALIGALLGSLVVAWAAWLRFRQERAFDRQLQWYEAIVRAVYVFTQKLEVALTHHAEESNPALIHESWREAQKAQLALERVCFEAPLFGSERAISIVGKIARTVHSVSDATNGIDPPSLEAKARQEAIQLIETLPEKLRQTAEPLALEARSHLSLG
jgi:hypothetical protein